MAAGRGLGEVSPIGGELQGVAEVVGPVERLDQLPAQVGADIVAAVEDQVVLLQPDAEAVRRAPAVTNSLLYSLARRANSSGSLR